MFWLYGIKENFVSFPQKKVKTPSCYFEKILIPGYLFHQKSGCPIAICTGPVYTVNFFKPLNIEPEIQG